MARMPGAAWIGPTPNQRVGGMSEHRGLVLHIQDGTEEGSEAWFKNPDSQASSHFLNPKSGGLRQLVDTDDRAWTEAAGNAYWVSIENEGLGGDALTPSQIENCAQLLAWLHRTYDVPLQSTDDPNGAGLGWHGMGGAAWGGHYDCPGEPVKAQRPAILARAQQIINPTEEDPLPFTEQDIRRFIREETTAATSTVEARNGIVYAFWWWVPYFLKGEVPQAAIDQHQPWVQLIPQVHAVLKQLPPDVLAQLETLVTTALANSTVHVQVDVTGPKGA
jgi:hypothetical protein